MLSGAFVSLHLIQQNCYGLCLLLIACLDVQYLTLDADDKLKLAYLLQCTQGGFQLTSSFPERLQCM